MAERNKICKTISTARSYPISSHQLPLKFTSPLAGDPPYLHLCPNPLLQHHRHHQCRQLHLQQLEQPVQLPLRHRRRRPPPPPLHRHHHHHHLKAPVVSRKLCVPLPAQIQVSEPLSPSDPLKIDPRRRNRLNRRRHRACSTLLSIFIFLFPVTPLSLSRLPFFWTRSLHRRMPTLSRSPLRRKERRHRFDRSLRLFCLRLRGHSTNQRQISAHLLAWDLHRTL
jgi:hypothetical protein